MEVDQPHLQCGLHTLRTVQQYTYAVGRPTFGTVSQQPQGSNKHGYVKTSTLADSTQIISPWKTDPRGDRRASLPAMTVTFPVSPLSSLDQTHKMGALEAGLPTQPFAAQEKNSSSFPRKLKPRNHFPPENMWKHGKEGRASQVTQTVKNLPAMHERWVRSQGGEDPLEEGRATHSSILAWRVPWTEEPAGLWSMGSPNLLTLCTSPHPLTRAV